MVPVLDAERCADALQPQSVLSQVLHEYAGDSTDMPLKARLLSWIDRRTRDSTVERQGTAAAAAAAAAAAHRRAGEQAQWLGTWR